MALVPGFDAKTVLKLDSGLTMLQATVMRLQGLNAEAALVICNEDHRFIAAEQLRQINQLNHNIVLEPAGRNTALLLRSPPELLLKRSGCWCWLPIM